MNSQIVHQIASYAFVLSFLTACGFSILSLIRKQDWLERLSAWSFVVSFGLLALAYVPGFGLEAALASAPQAVTKLAGRHHDMAKFVFTGMTLITAASLTVLVKFRKQRFPGWFLPNMLFIAVMIATFSIRSLVYAYQLNGHPQRYQQAPAGSATPAPAATAY